MLFSRRSATSACAIVLIVMAVTPYHRFSSSIGLASGAMTWLVILGACLAAFGHGVALRKGREIRRPGRLGVFGVFLAAIAVVPEWVDLAFYARGDSIPIVFAPIWLLHRVSCALCFTGSLLLSYVIWDTAGSPLIRGAARDGERGTRRSQSTLFAETIVVLSCLLFCCRISWRVVPEPWGMLSVTGASIGIVLLIPLVYLVLAAVPLLCCPRAFGRGQGDVFARSVLVAVPIGLVPAVEVAYFASDAAVIASLSMGSAIAVAAFVCTLLREKRGNNSDTPPARPTHSMRGCFPLPCRLEKSSLFDCCSKGKRRRKLPGRRVRSHRRCEQRFTEHTGRHRLRAHASSWHCLRVRVMLQGLVCCSGMLVIC